MIRAKTILGAPGLALALLVAACGGDATGPEPEPQPVVVSVTVAPASLDLTEGGASVPVTASVQVQGGSGSGPTVTWSSANPSVATVAGSGATASVTPVGPGTTVLSATAGGVTGTAAVTVKPGPKTLTLALSGQGTVGASVQGLACGGGSCTGTFPYGTTLTLTAVPVVGHRVAGWSGACQGKADDCTLVMDAPRTATLAFESKVEDNGLSKEINGFVPPTLIAILDSLGMPIHTGPTPPRIEGSYLMAPAMLAASTVPGDPATHQFADFYLKFSGQDDRALTVTTQTAQTDEDGTSVGDGLATFVVGRDSSFSAFARITTVQGADTTISLQVYSGRLVPGAGGPGGIRELRAALFMLDNRGNPKYIPNQTGRIVRDGDGFSPVAPFPAGAAEAAASGLGAPGVIDGSPGGSMLKRAGG